MAMFAGIVVARAWPDIGMTSQRWLGVPVKSVKISELIVTQKGIFFDALINKGAPVGSDPYPHVIQWKGKLYLEDGHTRTVRLAMEGFSTLSARVLPIY